MASSSSRTACEPRLVAGSGTLRNVLRLGAVLRVLLPEYRAPRRFGTAAADAAAPGRFAEGLLALGPVFVKLGQILSTGPDVIPEAYVEVLASLQEHAPPGAPAHGARQVIPARVGRDLTLPLRQVVG